MARAMDIIIVYVIGYKDSKYTAIPNAESLYNWYWENLKFIRIVGKVLLVRNLQL